MQEYVLVDSESISVEIYQRGEGKKFGIILHIQKASQLHYQVLNLLLLLKFYMKELTLKLILLSKNKQSALESFW
ncbi:MAG: hypothetical protein F6K40_12895 [Okeania sp. SIO3I5]|uniref:hypothetical protein n=1 Tax=Okeania sp. SIO3I5 TaxID=2607805 RepID=UPI0013B78FDA|nr:hypothetical protein [Okeania sp. SIO3I5]NEQ37113.1 hypothetical protein [Okeania sp. SIO3I5]